MPARKLFSFALILITLIVIGLSGMLGWRTIRQMGDLKTSITRIEAIEALANVQGLLSLERGVSTLALTNAGSGSAADRMAALHQARKNTDEVIAALLAHTGELAAADTAEASLLISARELAARVAASRDFCDEQLGLPAAGHGDAARQLISRMNDINARAADLLHGQVDKLAFVNGPAYAASQIASQASDLRAVAGAQAGLLEEWLVEGRPVDPVDRDRFLRYEGRVQQIWAGLLIVRKGLALSPGLWGAITQVDTGFMAPFQAIKQRLVPHFSDGAFPISVPAYRAAVLPLYSSILDLRDQAYATALGDVRAAYGQARAQVIASIIAALLALTALRAIFVRVNRKLTSLATHDALSGLPNRLLLKDRLGQMLEKAQRGGGRFALMFLDIDDFKTVNDSRGHHVGDQLLIAVSRCICDKLRAQDTVARVGGDEFVLLTEIRDPDDAATVAQKLISAISQSIMVVGHELHVTASIGIAVYPFDGTTQHDLMIHADTAMYHAKQRGKNSYCFYDAAMNADVQDHLSLLNDLRVALDRGELELHYQPKFLASNSTVCGAEALLRWRHPARGFIAPDTFIPLSEKNGLIIPIGAWVLDEACRQMAQWHRDGHGDWTIAVNLSPLQFCHARLIEVVSDALDRHALRPGSLTLEITETTAMRDAQESVAILDQLAAMGVQISIDDFGTGYSSLLYLKRLPATELKIDRSFVMSLVPDSDDAAIVSSIIALGQTLNMHVVAEGVETEAQRSLLTQLGCHSLQGYLLGKPMPASSFCEAAAAADAAPRAA
ncbi:MAG: putative bifunctional diguanylate cyclase/phosphodiesterase [Bordetella sp.]|uniref:putative bifunctional diguanylate cyclase/phosphodiesterase n=1 Tax=Bordetella sp. TaxID=28081 RepID=UPI003F7BFDE6